MQGNIKAQKEELLEQVAAMIQAKVPPARAALAKQFMRNLYRNAAPQDVLEREPDALFGAALALLNTGQTRQPKELKVRVYNPRFEENGWQSLHTVIEIVNDDMPFLVDSVTAELNRLEIIVHLVIHPVIYVTRNDTGLLTALEEPEGEQPIDHAESFMHIQVSEQSGEEAFGTIRDCLIRVLTDVRVATQDWPALRQSCLEVARSLEEAPPPLPEEEVREAIAFLHWMEEENFIFLGYRQYTFSGCGSDMTMAVVPGRDLGLLRDPDFLLFADQQHRGQLAPDVQLFLKRSVVMQVIKANSHSTVHRPVHIDVIMIKRFDDQGEVIAEHRFAGLFTSEAYNQSPQDIPLLRRKIEQVMALSADGRSNYETKTLLHILGNFPRDELFQADTGYLNETATGILHLQERQRIALFIRKDVFERFISALVYVPRDRFESRLRLRFQKLLSEAFDGIVSVFYTRLEETVHARIHLIIKTRPGRIPDYDPKALEIQLSEIARSWPDRLRQALVEELGEERGLALAHIYMEGFPTAYQETFTAPSAVFDILRVEQAIASHRLQMNLYRPIEHEAFQVQFKIYNVGRPLPLSDVLPVLEHMGLKVIGEREYEIHGRDHPVTWIHDFSMESGDGSDIDLVPVKRMFHDAFQAVWCGKMQNDGFNRLVMKCGLEWREVVVIRAYARYQKQIAFTFSQAYIEEALAQNPDVVTLILRLFKNCLEPAKEPAALQKSKRSGRLEREILAKLDEVENVDEDRILRRYLNLVQATLRTNFFQTTADGHCKPYLSLKFDGTKIHDLPLPRPMFEIFVYSPQMEAVHLRGGKVARGGIRWSDRMEDYRTEILGLMKAQMVKNAVIVPVGSKGGFVLKKPPRTGGREAMLREVVACYRTMMNGMLDITDNLVGGNVEPPSQVLRRDSDDPYLVVAADKGTATFSDLANGVSSDHGFWLDDAFASGGSVGYDHKKMGITARGAWESVKRHFREMGHNTQLTDFTVIGVGDMAGDVFGNGMLLSRHIRLVAAFNHVHIFFDPDPNAELSWEERKRLFETPRCSWMDYDRTLISKGGGVFDRKAKSIPVSLEMRALLGLTQNSVTPNQLIRQILKAPVDLLWFGGIGTYVKAVHESHGDVNDRTNDLLRVNATEVRAKVIAEGANLGLTQRGRVEFALGGGRLNTDAIDNSAGVDCSDHEVNIKILLGSVMDSGDMTLKQRNELLEAMTDDVATLVLRNNYEQTQAISQTVARGLELFDQMIRLMRFLERSGRLDRTLEFLPYDDDLVKRRSSEVGLLRPEISVLVAYAKNALFDELLASDLPDDAALGQELIGYFPIRLQERYPDHIACHRLRREIIATQVTNNLINRAGPTFVSSKVERTGATAPDIARAYLIARDVFQLQILWEQIESLDSHVSVATQISMLHSIGRLLEHVTRWFLRYGLAGLDITLNVEAYKLGVAEIFDHIGQLITDNDIKALAVRRADLARQQVPALLAERLANLTVLASACDIVRISEGCSVPVLRAATLYYKSGARFHLDWLRQTVSSLPADSYWKKMGITTIEEDFFSHQAQITNAILSSAKPETESDAAIDQWIEKRKVAVSRTDALMMDLMGGGPPDLAMMAVANGQFRTLLAD